MPEFVKGENRLPSPEVARLVHRLGCCLDLFHQPLPLHGFRGVQPDVSVCSQIQVSCDSGDKADTGDFCPGLVACDRLKFGRND